MTSHKAITVAQLFAALDQLSCDYDEYEVLIEGCDCWGLAAGIRKVEGDDSIIIFRHDSHEFKDVS